MMKGNKKRQAEEDPEPEPGNDETELEIQSYDDMTSSVAKDNHRIHKLRISCFVKATSPRGFPANGMTICHETAARIPSFVALFPNLEEVHLGGWSIIKEDIDPKPFFFSLMGESIRREKDERIVIASIRVVFKLVNALCAAYRTGALPAHVKIFGLFDPPSRFSRHNLLCADQIYEDDYSTEPPKVNRRDGTSCETCRTICRSINLEQAMALRCAEGDGDSPIGRLEFLGCQLCLTSQTKFEILSSRPGAKDLLCRHLLNVLSDTESVQIDWYMCDETGEPTEGGKFRSGMLRYARGPTDQIVKDEIGILFTQLKDEVTSSGVVRAIVSNQDAKHFMIDETIYVTGDTWKCLKDAVSATDKKRFHTIDTEKYCCWDEDMIYSRKCWREES